jgi:hypothetical protein
MAKVKPMGLIESMSGKVCRHSNVYFFRRNGKIFTGKRCHPSTKAPTTAQTAQQNKFATAHANAATALADPTQRAALMAAFRNQQKYSTLNGYVFALEYRKLND